MGPSLILQSHVGSIDVSGANTIYMRTMCPLRVNQWGFIVTTVIASAAIVITGNIVEVDTTATSPTGAAALGTCTATSSSMALNTGVYNDVNITKGNRIIYPGEALSFACTTPGTGVVQVFVLYELLGFNSADQRSHVSSHPGSTTLTNSFTNLTRVSA